MRGLIKQRIEEMEQRMKRCILVPALIAALILTACGAQDPETEEQPLRFAYISKDLDHYWFQQIAEGIRNKCLELGCTCDTFDAHFDDDVCMDLVQQVVDQDYDGLMICTTNQDLGDDIGKLCEEAGIPVVTIDDTMKDHNGKMFSHVGMATRETGGIGVEMAKFLVE